MAPPARFNPMRRRIPILKRIVPSLKRRWWRLRHPDGTGIVATQGVEFLLNPENFVDRQVAFYDDFERAQLAYLTQTMETMGCTRFIDIGAAFGYYAIILATRFPALSVIAIEPDVRNLEQLRANLTLNGLGGRVKVHAAAASAAGGTVAFQPGAASSTGQSRVTSTGDMSIAALAIDDVVDALGEAIAAKIDVEEHELQVLKGMERILRDNDCVLQIEIYQEHIDPVSGFLAARGYRLAHRIEHDHYFVRFRAETGSRARTAP